MAGVACGAESEEGDAGAAQHLCTASGVERRCSQPPQASEVPSSTAGVIIAAVPQPHLRKTNRAKSIMASAATPVADENDPMKAE